MDKIIIAVIGVVVVMGGIYVYSNNQKEAAIVEQKAMMEEKKMMEAKAVEEKEQMKNQEMTKKDGETVVSKEETSMMKDGAEEAMKKEEMMDSEMKMGSYESYSSEKLARAETGDVVLFFHASWCPSCRGLSTNIEGNLKSIPEGVSILKLDYDKETELKKKYGVTNQHTLVQVDVNGNMIKKWSGGGSLDDLLSQIK